MVQDLTGPTPAAPPLAANASAPATSASTLRAAQTYSETAISAAEAIKAGGLRFQGLPTLSGPHACAGLCALASHAVLSPQQRTG